MWLTPGCSLRFVQHERRRIQVGGPIDLARQRRRLLTNTVTRQVGIQLARGAQVIGEAIDHHGGLLGGGPPEAFVAMVHEPQRRLGQQRAIAALVREELHGVGGGLRRDVFGEVEHLVARGGPPGLLGILLRGGFEERRRSRAARAVFGLLQREAENAPDRKATSPSACRRSG